MTDPAAPAILWVDDEPLVARLYARAVANAGYRAVIAHDAGDALDLFWSARPALVVTDMRLGLMTGLELTNELRTKDFHRCPVLLASADDSVPLLTEGLEAGVDDFLVKGMPFAALTSRLRFWIEGPFSGQPDHVRAAAQRTLKRISPMAPPFARLQSPLWLLAERARTTLSDMLMNTPEDFGETDVDKLRLLGALDGILALLCKTNALAQLRRVDVMAAALKRHAPAVLPMLHEINALAAEPVFAQAAQSLVLSYGPQSPLGIRNGQGEESESGGTTTSISAGAPDSSALETA